MTDEEKKEKMNFLMNKISFELKDDILAQGFEIICNRISELEKEKEELKKKLDEIRDYLAYKIPHDLINEATNKIWSIV